MTDIIVKYGADQYLFDIDNNRYIDLRMGAGTMVLGHNNDFMLNDIKENMNKGFLFSTNTYNELELIQTLNKTLPWCKKFIFCNTGTDAIMKLIRLARAITNKKKICILAGCWHGGYNEVLLEENYETNQSYFISNGLLENIKDNIIVLPNNIENIENILNENYKDIALVLIEPIQQTVPQNINDNLITFLKKIRQITHDKNILLGFDEIITGFRFGPKSIQEYLDIYSDITCFGKIISGGFPISFISISNSIFDKYNNLEKNVFLGGTFTANPISTFTCNKVINYLKNNIWIYEKIKKYTVEFCTDINNHCYKNNFDFQIIYSDYFFRFIFTNKKINSRKERYIYENKELQNKFYKYLLEKKIYIGKNPLCFFSIKHTNEDICYIKKMVINILNKLFVKNNLDFKGITKINNLLNYDNINNINTLIKSKNISDLEPYSNCPYRTPLKISELDQIDTTIMTKINNIIKDTFDDKFNIYSINIHFKNKWIGSEEHWHQDYSYNKNTHDGNYYDFYRIFIALEEHTENNGNMLFMENSHNEEELEHDKILSIHTYQKNRIKIKILQKLYDKYNIQSYPLNKGDGIIFNSLIAHSSNSNLSPKCRKAIQIQLVRNNTKLLENEKINDFRKYRKTFEINILNNFIKNKNNEINFLNNTNVSSGEFDYIFKKNDNNLIYIANEETFNIIYKEKKDPWCQSNINDSYYKLVRNKLVEILQYHININILEIGCGNGFSTHYLYSNLKNKNNTFFGCDCSNIAIKNALENYSNISFFTHNIKNKFTLTTKFDYVIFGDLLWYILDDLELCINNAIEILNKNGKIIFYNAFLKEQRYGKNIIDGFEGLVNFIKTKFKKKNIYYEFKSNFIEYKYLGLVIFSIL